MPRGEKPAEANSDAELAAARKSLRNEASRRRELEQRLAESLEREKATGAILQEKDRALTEALEQQTAASEILRTISSSPTDLQPVLNTVVESAARFCGAYDASLFRLEGAALKLVAHHGPIHVPSGMLLPVVRGTVGGRSVLERRAIHVADLQAKTEEYPEGSALARDFGHHTALAVPLLREGEVIGGIQLRRAAARSSNTTRPPSSSSYAPRTTTTRTLSRPSERCPSGRARGSWGGRPRCASLSRSPTSPGLEQRPGESCPRRWQRADTDQQCSVLRT